MTTAIRVVGTQNCWGLSYLRFMITGLLSAVTMAHVIGNCMRLTEITFAHVLAAIWHGFQCLISRILCRSGMAVCVQIQFYESYQGRTYWYCFCIHQWSRWNDWRQQPNKSTIGSGRELKINKWKRLGLGWPFVFLQAHMLHGCHPNLLTIIEYQQFYTLEWLQCSYPGQTVGYPAQPGLICDSVCLWFCDNPHSLGTIQNTRKMFMCCDTQELIVTVYLFKNLLYNCHIVNTTITCMDKYTYFSDT